eukprot:6002810-Prymnesium_polylepis.1
MAGTAMEEWVAVTCLPTQRLAGAGAPHDDAGGGVDHRERCGRERSESARPRRAEEARRAVAVEAGAAKQPAEREDRK